MCFDVFCYHFEPGIQKKTNVVVPVNVFTHLKNRNKQSQGLLALLIKTVGMRPDAFLPGHLCKTVCDYSRPDDGPKIRKVVRKGVTRNLLHFPLNLSSRKWTQTRGFLSLFLRRNNSKVIAQRNATKCFLMLKLRYQCLENLFSLKNLLSTLSNTAFPKSIPSAATRARNLHHQQILWKNPLAQGLQLRFSPKDLVPCPPCFMYYTSDYLKFFWKYWICGGKKSHRDVQK